MQLRRIGWWHDLAIEFFASRADAALSREDMITNAVRGLPRIGRE